MFGDSQNRTGIVSLEGRSNNRYTISPLISILYYLFLYCKYLNHYLFSNRTLRRLITHIRVGWEFIISSPEPPLCKNFLFNKLRAQIVAVQGRGGGR